MSEHASAPEEKAGLVEVVKSLVGGSRGYLVVNLINFGDGIAYFGILTLLTLFQQRDVGFSEDMAGVTVSFFTGAVTLFMLIGGFVSDNVGVRRALTLSLLFLLVGRLLLLGPSASGPGGAAMSFSMLSLLLMAIGSGVLQPALYAGVKEYTDQKSASMGYAFLYSIMNLGIVAELWVSPFIRMAWAEHVEGASPDDPAAGISGAFLFCAAITAAMLLAHLVLFTRRVEERDRQLTEPEPEPEAATGTVWQRIKALPVMDARFLFFIFILLPVRTLFAHQWLTMPDYVTRCFPVEVGQRFEWISGLNPLIIVIFVPLITAFTQRVHVFTMMIVGSLITALSTFMIAGEPDLTLLLAYVVAFSLGEAAWSSRFLEYVADLAPAGKVGAYMGIALLPWFVAKFTTGLYSGFMVGEFIPKEGPQDPGPMWMIYGFIALLSPIGLLLARKWLMKGVPDHRLT